MRRAQLFEFGNQRWFPQILRDAETAYLATAYRFMPLAKLWAEKLSAGVKPGDPVQIVDL